MVRQQPICFGVPGGCSEGLGTLGGKPPNMARRINKGEISMRGLQNIQGIKGGRRLHLKKQ